jgi:hypothetical protein
MRENQDPSSAPGCPGDSKRPKGGLGGNARGAADSSASMGGKAKGLYAQAKADLKLYR